MKQLILICLIASSIAMYAQNYGLGNTDPSVFTKYRIPETKLSSLYFNTNFSYSSINNIQSGKGLGYYYDNSNFTSNLRYQLTPKYQYLNERDDQVISFNANLDGIYSYYGQKSSDYTNEANNKHSNFILDLSAGYYKYNSTDNLFFNIAGTVNVNIDEYYNKYYDSPNDTYHGTKNQDYALRLGIGWGKIRNVTSVVSAIRLQERLKQLSLINDDLSENAINDLAQQFSKESYYDSIHSLPGKYFWQSLEDVITKNGISLKGLNEYGRLFLQETPYEIKFSRREGMEAMLDLRINYSGSYSSSSIMVTENLSPQLYAFYEYDHQLNLNSQIRSYISFYGGPNLIDNSPINQSYGITLNLGYDYEITNRFVVSLENSLMRSFTNQRQDRSQQKSFVDNLSLSFDYFIEDQISLNAAYRLNYIETNYQYIKSSGLTNNISVGITYYIDRGFIIK